MPVAKVVNAQRDFSGGEADQWIKRSDDHPLLKTTARQAVNWRPLSSRGLSNRPGRHILTAFLNNLALRVDEVIMSPGNNFYLVFGNAFLRVYNASFILVFDSGNVMPWTTTTAKTIVWDYYKLQIFICFDGMQPRVLTWDGVSQLSTWTLDLYREDLASSGQKRTIFYRLSPRGITLKPSAPVGGAVNSLTIQTNGTFTQVPSVTIGPPGAGGTTATATATIVAATVTISDGGLWIDVNPVGTLVRLPNAVALRVTSVSVVPGGSATGYIVTGVSIDSAGSIAAGSAPSNPITAISVDSAGIYTFPKFNLTWQLGPLTLTNAGGTGYSSPPTVSLSPSGGAIVTATISVGSGATNTTLVFSAGMTLTNEYIGTRVQYCSRQILITGVSSPTVATGIIEESLFQSFTCKTSTNANLSQFFSIGAEVIGNTSGAKGVIVSISADGITATIQIISGTVFLIPEVCVGPTGSILIDVVVAGNLAPEAVTVWDDEVMNAYRGWPRSCFVDQGRLGFCDFPALPQLTEWSAQGDFNDLYTDANNVGPTNAIQELVPGKSRVLYVVPGAEGSEFVFCDNAVYYIPINQTTPLKPGSVAFNTLLSEGCAQVQPRPVQQSIVFVSAGFTQMKAVQAIGAYNRPYIVDDISELHSHLLKTPVAIAAPGGSDQFEESYFYIANADGSLILCSFDIANGVINTKTIGWLPWNGAGTATWVSALKGHSDVLITSTYAPNGIAAVGVIEQVDATQYLDAAMLYNSAPAALAPPGGKGPLWWLAGGTVDLMDGLRMMGTYQIDANGRLVPQNNAGEDFTSVTLAVGQAWTATLEPFIPAGQPGQDVNQRMRKRRLSRFEVYVQNSTGFTVCRLEGGPVTRTSPAIGTIMQRRRIEAWNQDDDPTVAPPLREQAYSFRALGREHDPRRAIIKDTPGPLTVLEIDMEVTV